MGGSASSHGATARIKESKAAEELALKSANAAESEKNAAKLRLAALDARYETLAASNSANIVKQTEMLEAQKEASKAHEADRKKAAKDYAAAQQKAEERHDALVLAQQIAQDHLKKELLDQKEASERQHNEMLENQKKASEMLMEQYDQFKKENEKFQQAVDKANEDAARAKLQFSEQGTVEQFDKTQATIFSNLLQSIEEIETSVTKTKKPSIAVLGAAGVGKSSLINAIAGQVVARTGEVDTTVDIAKVTESSTCELWDVPGCDDERSYSNLANILKMKQMHLILLVYAERVRSIIKLEKLIMACKVPCIVVRQKCDAMSDLEGSHAVENKLVKSTLLYCSANTGYNISKLRNVALESHNLIF